MSYYVMMMMMVMIVLGGGRGKGVNLECSVDNKRVRDGSAMPPP